MMGKKLKHFSKVVLAGFTLTVVVSSYQNCAEQKLASTNKIIQPSTGDNGRLPPLKCSPDLPSPRNETGEVTTSLVSTCPYGGDKRQIDTHQKTLSCQQAIWTQTNDVIIDTRIEGSCNLAPAINCGSVLAGQLVPPTYYGNNATVTESCAAPGLTHQVTYQKLESYICDGGSGTLIPSGSASVLGAKISETPCGCLDQNLQARQNAETWAIGTTYEKSVLKKLYRCENGSTYEMQSDCTSLADFNDSSVSATSALQSCVNNTTPFLTLRLPAGKYSLATELMIDKSINITTIGKDFSSAPCMLSDPRCATLSWQTNNDLIELGFIKVRANDVSINSIIIDGNQEARFGSTADLNCRAGSQNNKYGFNMTMYNYGNHIIQNSVFKNALCGTALAYVGSQLTFKSNLVADNGRHDQRFAWADGLTLLISPNSYIANNLFVDNTDVQLIFGSCPNCEVKNNIIRHTGKFGSSSFAALLVHAWPGGTDGDYRNSFFNGNIIDCHPSRRCGIGFGIGGQSWYTSPTFGGEYSFNKIKNAMIGLNVNDATAPAKVTLRANTVESSGGQFTCSGFSCSSAPINISPNSIAWVDADFNTNMGPYNQDFFLKIPNYDGGGGPNDLGLTEFADSSAFMYANDYIRNLYLNFLEREPDDGGQIYWMGICRNNARLATQSITLSSEAQGTTQNPGSVYDKRKFAIALYKGLLGRQPSESEIQNASAQDAQTIESRTNLVDLFLNSPEFKNKFKTFECQ